MKHVRCATHDAIGRFRAAKVTWCDVWLRLHDRRRTVRLAPTLCGYLDLLSEIDLDDDMVKEYPAEAWTHEGRERHLWAQRSIEQNGHAIDNSGDPEMPHIYSKHHYIDRAEAERLLTLWLSGSLFFVGPFKFHWKPPKYITNPVTLNTERVRAAVSA